MTMPGNTRGIMVSRSRLQRHLMAERVTSHAVMNATPTQAVAETTLMVRLFMMERRILSSLNAST